MVKDKEAGVCLSLYCSELTALYEASQELHIKDNLHYMVLHLHIPSMHKFFSPSPKDGCRSLSRWMSLLQILWWLRKKSIHILTIWQEHEFILIWMGMKCLDILNLYLVNFSLIWKWARITLWISLQYDNILYFRVFSLKICRN